MFVLLSFPIFKKKSHTKINNQTSEYGEGAVSMVPKRGSDAIGALLGPLRMQIFPKRERGLHEMQCRVDSWHFINLPNSTDDAEPRVFGR